MLNVLTCHANNDSYVTIPDKSYPLDVYYQPHPHEIGGPSLEAARGLIFFIKDGDFEKQKGLYCDTVFVDDLRVVGRSFVLQHPFEKWQKSSFTINDSDKELFDQIISDSKTNNADDMTKFHKPFAQLIQKTCHPNYQLTEKMQDHFNRETSGSPFFFKMGCSAKTICSVIVVCALFYGIYNTCIMDGQLTCHVLFKNGTNH